MSTGVFHARHSLIHRASDWIWLAGPLALFFAWTALVGLHLLADIDTGVTRFWDDHHGHILDQLAAVGSPLFGVVGAGILAGALGLFLLWRQRLLFVVALVAALAISGGAERGMRALFVQPSDPALRSTAYIRSQGENTVPAIGTIRLSLPALNQPDPNHSYPSGHATVAAALLVFAAVSFRQRTQRRIVCSFALTMLFAYGAWSEVYRGTHVLSDAIGGLLLGCLIATLCGWLAWQHERRMTASIGAGPGAS